MDPDTNTAPQIQARETAMPRAADTSPSVADLRKRMRAANALAMAQAATAKQAGGSWNEAYVASLRESGFSLRPVTFADAVASQDIYWAVIPEHGEDAYPFPCALV